MSESNKPKPLTSFQELGKAMGRSQAPQRVEEWPQAASDYFASLKTGYFQGENLRLELLTTQARSLAKHFLESDVTSSQIRYFFTRIRYLERRLKARPSQFDFICVELARLDGRAAMMVARKLEASNQRVSQEAFRQFIERNVALATKDAKHFLEGFVPHFEAVLCYHKYFEARREYEKAKNRERR